MARQPRVTPPGVPLHIIQRGNNRQAMFHDDEDRGLFSAWLSQYARERHVVIHAWVYMTNHIHLLLTPQEDRGLPAMMQALGRQYVRYFNKRHKRTGTLYEGRYKSCIVDSDQYLLTCYRYIEMNPVRARMVREPGHYRWSSYGHNAHGQACGFLEPHLCYLGLGDSPASRQRAYRKLFEHPLDEDIVGRIREATNRGHVFGRESFTSALEADTGARLRPGKPGRPRRDKMLL